MDHLTNKMYFHFLLQILYQNPVFHSRNKFIVLRLEETVVDDPGFNTSGHETLFPTGSSIFLRRSWKVVVGAAAVPKLVSANLQLPMIQ